MPGLIQGTSLYRKILKQVQDDCYFLDCHVATLLAMTGHLTPLAIDRRLTPPLPLVYQGMYQFQGLAR